MASVTQTIPQFSLGMSEQPDNLKFPGQVTDIVNAIPDVTKGLFKRPGAKRIGTSPLANVQTGGSWFHYFRDETEGSYIGQVASNGQVRVWRCSDGQQMTTQYGQHLTFSNSDNYNFGDRIIGGQNDLAVYEAQSYISSGGSKPTHASGELNGWLYIAQTSAIQTNIQNYLTTATPENLQFLTINDTTFVTNRDSTDARKQYTTVGESGSTTARPDAHFAMLELLRTENGRQYGIDVFRTADVTTLTRATRIKISADTLYEGDGSGSCPGIGTQVFSVDSGNKKNLIFRINTLGQQGVSPNYDAQSEGPDGDNYQCSYQREVVLLHGGEGWVVGDTVTVTLDSAKGGGGNKAQSNSGTNATYTIRVEEIETTQVNATIDPNNTGDGLIRPEPTPFDAQTAVTADTIIGGIISELPNGVSGKQIGNGIYLSSTNSFTVNIVENDLMRVMQGSVNDVQNLPNQCKHGYIVKVSNALRSEEDDYYLKFEGQNDNDGSGSWTECALPGITKRLTNMPVVIQRTGTTTFTVREFAYALREVGDTATNPVPSFVGKQINKVLFFRNRLAFLAGENVITSRPGTLNAPDFFIETALTVSVADPVDISAASMFPSDLFDGIEINAGLLVFSTNQQFLLASDDTVFNPDTAKLRSIATFNYNEKMPPISLGTTVAYIDNSGKFSRFNEMANSAREGEPNIIEVSKVVPTLLPKDIDLMTNSRENSIVLIGKTASDDVFGYKYFQTAEKRVQAAWFKWKLNRPLIYHFIINDEYFFLDSDYYLQSIKLVQAEDDPSIVQDSVEFLLHFDNYTTITGGVFDPATTTTTFSSVAWIPLVGNPNHELLVIDTNTDSERIGRYAKPVGARITVPTSAITMGGNTPITSTNHGLTTGDKLIYDSNGGASLVTNVTNNIYYAMVVDANTFRLSDSVQHANIGTTLIISDPGNDNQFFKVSQNKIVLKGNWDYSEEYDVKGGTNIVYPFGSASTNNQITIYSHGFVTGDAVRYVLADGQGGSALTGLTSGTIYYTIRLNNNQFKLATSLTNAENGTSITFNNGGGFNTMHRIQKVITNLRAGYLYPYEVKLPTLYPTKIEGQRSTADVNSSLVLHRVKFHFGKIGLYETTLERVGKTDYTEVYESTELDEYDASDAPYLEEFIKTVPVYEKNTNVEITLKSSHPAPATLRSLSWEGDYSPKYYRRV